MKIKDVIREKISEAFASETNEKVRTIFQIHFMKEKPLVYGVLGNNGKWLGIAELSPNSDDVLSICL